MRVGRLARRLQRAAEAGKARAEKNTAGEQQRWLTPSAPTISRSCVAARTSTPQRVLCISSHSAPSTTGPWRSGTARRPGSGGRGSSRSCGNPARADPGCRAAPRLQRQVLHHQHDAEGGEQLEQLRHAIDAPQQQHLHQHAEHADAAAPRAARRPRTRAGSPARSRVTSDRRSRRPACRTSRARN